MKRKIAALQEIYKTRLHEHSEEVRVKFASAWYYVAYSKPYKPQGLNSPVLSFPWIAGDYLISAFCKSENTPSDFEKRSSILFTIGKDILQQSIDFLGEDYISFYIERIQFKNLLDTNINARLGAEMKPQVSFKYVGSSASGMFFRSSDVNLVCSSSNGISFSQDILPAVSEMFHVTIQNDQIIHRGRPFSFVISQDNVEGLEQVKFIRGVVTDHPLLLAYMVVIQRWARAQNIVRKSSFHSGQISSTQLSSLLLTFMCRHLKLTPSSAEDEDCLAEKQFEWLSSIIASLKSALVTDDSDMISAMGAAFFTFIKFMTFSSEAELIYLFHESKCHQPVKTEFITSFREHFFKAFHILSQSLNVSSLWNVIVSAEVEQEVTLARRPGLFKRLGPSSAVFMEGSAVVLFEGAKSDLDQVTFELYQLRRRPHHVQKQCFFPVLREPVPFLYTNTSCKTYNDYFSHAIRQFDLARRTGSPEFGNLKMAIKFGNLYLTNLPKMFLEEGLSANVENTRKALMLGYKRVADTRTKALFDPSIPAKLDHMRPMNEVEEKVGKAVLTPADIIQQHEDDDGDEAQLKSMKAIVHRKTNLTAMTSSFEPYVHTDAGIRQFIQEFNLRPETSLSGYAVSLTLYNAATETNSDYQVIYDSEMKFMRLSDRPLRWMAIDLKNQEVDGEDLRLTLTSRRDIIKIEGEEEEEDEFKKRLRSGVVQFLDEAEIDDHINRRGNVLRVVPEFLTNERLFVRSSHQERHVLTQASVHLLTTRYPVLCTCPSDLLSKIVIRISWISEYADHDPQTGRFPSGPSEKVEVELDANIDWDELAVDRKSQQCIQLLYHLGFILKLHYLNTTIIE